MRGIFWGDPTPSQLWLRLYDMLASLPLVMRESLYSFFLSLASNYQKHLWNIDVLKFWKSQVWSGLIGLASSYQQDDGAPETIGENSWLFSSFLTLSRCLPVLCLPSSSKLMASQVFFTSPFSDKSLWFQYALWCLRFSPISSSWFDCLKSTCRHNNSLALSAS